MAVRYLSQDEVAAAAVTIARAAATTLDIASPWIEPIPVQKLVGELLPRVRAGDVTVRLVYRVSEEGDLRITDLAALEMLAAEGVQVRYSRRLHAKLVIADRSSAVVGSSNLTRRGGYGYGSQPLWRNQEGGVLLEDEPAAGEAARHFDEIWDGAEEVAPDLVGVVMDFPTVHEFRFVAVAEIAAGQLVSAVGEAGASVVGEVVELTTYNQSFPQMTEEMFLTQGYGGRGERRVHLPDIPSLFSHPVKDRGFLVAKTFFQPESAFQIARVKVLRQLRDGEAVAAVQPIAPGANVVRPQSNLLRKLLGAGDVRVGRMQHHPDVGVWIRSDELLTTHLGVLGMTGSGKSNGVKHLLRELMPSDRGLRVYVIDTHGEYATAASEIDSNNWIVDVSIPDKVNLLDWEMVREHFSVERMSAKIKNALRAASREPDTAAAIAALHAVGGNELEEIAEALEDEPDSFCFGVEDPRIVASGTDDGAELDQPGLYVLDLRETETFAVRSKKCAVLADRVFRDAKAAKGERPALLVVDEAHNYIPERTTGYMAEAARHGSLGALTTIAVEGRKFRVGLLISSQRPSRIAKDVLAQMNSQLIFRLANVEDLGYVRESFEAAGSAFLADLPTLDTGVCLCAGTMIAMPVRCDVPLFAHRERTSLAGPIVAQQRGKLAEVVRSLLPEASIVADEPEVVVLADPRAEVTIRGGDGLPVLEVTTTEGELAERIREAIASALATPRSE
jgi:hypothetical protein